MGRNDTLPVRWDDLQQNGTKPRSPDPWQQNPQDLSIQQINTPK